MEQLNKIYNNLLKAQCYINIIKSYCENEMHDSEQISDVYTLICDVQKFHKKITDSFDEALISITN